MIKISKINKEILIRFVENGFFDDWKTLNDVCRKFSKSGFSIKEDKKGLVAQLLTFLCQKDIIEREELPKNEWELACGKWKYKKVK